MAGIGLDEFVENLVALFLWHADAGVAHVEAHEVTVVQRHDMRVQLDAAAFGELDRVADQVGQHLAQAHAVAADDERHRRVDRRYQFDALVMGARTGEFDDTLDQGAQFDLVLFRREGARFDLGEIQNVADQREQCFA